jgi:undecaprenyl-diphosphatase
VTYLQALVLGIVQGLTEFLPVSSSGHLVLGQAFFGVDADVLTFDIAVHFGTLMAVFIVFRYRIVELLAGIMRDIRAIGGGERRPGAVLRESREIRYALAIIIGTVPAVIVGFTIKDIIGGMFLAVTPVLWALAFTGMLLLATFAAGNGSRRIGLRSGLMIGIAQALAVVPGISRSGMTIATALFVGIDREEAGEFSFMLAIPAVLGASLLETLDLVGEGGFGSVAPGPVLAGTVAAFCAGWVSLAVLMRVVRRGKLGWFGFYCLAVAGIGLILR